MYVEYFLVMQYIQKINIVMVNMEYYYSCTCYFLNCVYFMICFTNVIWPLSIFKLLCSIKTRPLFGIELRSK